MISHFNTKYCIIPLPDVLDNLTSKILALKFNIM